MQNSSQASTTSDLGSDQLDTLEVSNQCQGTLQVTKWGMEVFNDWCNKRKISVAFENVSPEELAEVLRKFYAEVKGNEGKTLTPSSMVGLRDALHRHITTPPISRTMNIVNDKEFLRANQMFLTIFKKYYKDGNARPKHKPAIQPADMEKLRKYFQGYAQSPQILTEYVWFLLCFHFGRRGREGWVAMTKTTFVFCTDSEGKEYVKYGATETTKNHQGGYKQKDTDYSDGRMYGIGVTLLKFMIGKLHPDLDRLFQHPGKVFDRNGPWYRKEPIGKDTMGKIMTNISKKAGLSTTYTCHCVRASTITTLLESGVDPTVIVQITKHKNVSSLQHYVSGLSDKEHQKTHDILARALSSVQGKKSDKQETLGELPECNFDKGDEQGTLGEIPECNFDIGELPECNFNMSDPQETLEELHECFFNPMDINDFNLNGVILPDNSTTVFEGRDIDVLQNNGQTTSVQASNWQQGSRFFHSSQVSFNNRSEQNVGNVGQNGPTTNPQPPSFAGHGAVFNLHNCNVNFYSTS